MKNKICLLLFFLLFYNNISFANIINNKDTLIINEKCVIIYINDNYNLVLDKLESEGRDLRNDLILENGIFITDCTKFIKSKKIKLIKIYEKKVLRFKLLSNKIITINLKDMDYMVDIYYFNRLKAPILVEDCEEDYYKYFK